MESSGGLHNRYLGITNALMLVSQKRKPLMPLMGRGMSLIINANFDNLAKMRFFKKKKKS